MQLAELKVPAPLLCQVTVPVGMRGVPGDVSDTVPLQIVGWLTANIDGVQVIWKKLDRFVTVSENSIAPGINTESPL